MTTTGPMDPLASMLASVGLRSDEQGIWHAADRGSVSYPAHGNLACLEIEDSSFWFRHRNRCIASLVRRFHRGGPFLDVGGGNGYVARGLMQAGIDCVLVEPGPDGAQAARQRGVPTVICATLAGANLPAGCMAAAGMFDVLEHIADEAGALAQLHHVVAPGGAVFISVPAYGFLTSDEDREAGHYRRYTTTRLAAVLEHAGFTMRHATYLFAPLPLPVLLARTIPSLLGWRRAAAAAAEHHPGGLAARIMDRLLAWEFARIDAGGTIPFGTSCLAVAIKR